jgi:hypothetical protein
MAIDYAAVIDNAIAEWHAWGDQTWEVRKAKPLIAEANRDDSRVRAKYVHENYCVAANAVTTIDAIQSDEFAWSATFISFIFRSAGFTAKEFPRSAGHHSWIRRAIAERNAATNIAYIAYRMAEPQAMPEVGDLVAYARPFNDGESLSYENAQKWFDIVGQFKSHSDIVVKRNKTSIEVIGGNVIDSVTKKIIPINTDGSMTDRSHAWFAVLKKKGDAG